MEPSTRRNLESRRGACRAVRQVDGELVRRARPRGPSRQRPACGPPASETPHERVLIRCRLAGFPDAWRLWRPHQAFGIDRRAAKRSFWHGLAGNRLRGEDLDVTPRSLNRFNRSSTSKNLVCLRIESSPIHPSQWNQKGGELASFLALALESAFLIATFG
jgi:hypothetical protein